MLGIDLGCAAGDKVLTLIDSVPLAMTKHFEEWLKSFVEDRSTFIDFYSNFNRPCSIASCIVFLKSIQFFL